MQSKPIINSFEGGMFKDSLPYLQPKSTYRHARNMVNGDRDGMGYGLSTEESNKLLHQYGSKIVSWSYVESLDASVVFTQDQTIHLFDHTTYKSTAVASASEFGCDWGFQGCEWISTTYKTDQPCNEIKVYWSSGCEYYVLNITEMLNPSKKAALIELIKNQSNDKGSCGYTCEYFKLMKCICAPTITALPRGTGGNRLEAGVYQFAVQLEDNGGNKTNWFYVSNPVSVGSENNIAGEPSLESIDVHITGLDCRYDKINIAVVSSIDGSMAAEVVASRHYTNEGITFTYTGQTGKTISIDDILIKNKMFIRGKDLIQKDSRLFLYNIRQENNLNMQRQVLEEAKLEFIEIETTPKMVEKYGLKTLERGERYLFGVTYNYCDGTHSNVFVMRPNGGIECGGPAGFGPGFTPPTGKGIEVKRPRGSADAEGGVYGCGGGKCGGCGTQGCGQIPPAAGFGPDPGNEENDYQLDTADGVLPNVQNATTSTADLVEASKCDNCVEPWCCDPATGECLNCGDLATGNCDGCQKDEEVIANDLPKFEDIFAKHTDELADANQDNDPNYSSSTFKTGAEKFIESTLNSEIRVIKDSQFVINTKLEGTTPGERNEEGPLPDSPVMASPPRPTGGVSETVEYEPSNEVEGFESYLSIWSDDFSDGRGNYLLDEVPVEVGCFIPKTEKSTERYPDSLDCDGEFLYGSLANQPIELFKTPTATESPIISPTSSGVPSPNSSVDPIYDVKIRLLGIRAQVPMPEYDQLPKPLCPNNPYSIVMVPRDEINSTVQAKGVFCGTFIGRTSANEFATFIRHGANSRTYIDRWISDGPSKNRKGFGPGPGFAFYGLDTSINKVGLSARQFVTENIYRGQGYRYGLYEKGIEPDERLTGRRVDQRGARQYLNINIPEPFVDKSPIKAVGYCSANTRNYITGATYEVSTLDRESCVYFELDGGFGQPIDKSFSTDTMDHACPVESAFMWYGHFYRDIPDQYGSLPGMTFVRTGVEGRGFQRPYQGIVGDTFIGPMSFVKKGYVSDKVGNLFPTEGRDRSVCDSPNDLLLQQMGMDFYPTQLPISGDQSDAKNWAGGHRNLRWNVANDRDPEFDYYYPKVVKTLIVTWVESRVNPWKRATGPSAAESGQIFYPKLKGHNLDSAVSTDRKPWEKSFLNRFYYRLDQPSVAQLTRKALIKVMINYILPMLGLSTLADLQSVPDAVGTILIAPVLIAYWYNMKKLLSREDYLDKMLGFPTCKTDAAGGETDNSIENFEDNFYLYNADYSKTNYENIYQAMPAVYNTCICNNCNDGETTNEIYYSKKQIEGSPIDFYKQFQALSYLNIPHDSGKLMKMFVLNGDLFAHTTDFIIPIKLGSFKETSNGSGRLGGEFIIDPSPFLEGTPEGFAGITDPNSAINTVYGYLFVDRSSRKVYLFNGQAPVSISNGVDKFFKEHLDFCEVSSCHDEKVESGTYYSLGYDPMFNRVLITKKELNSDYSFTISAEISDKDFLFTSFHDYIPQAYVWDRANLFSSKNNGIYLHNANDGTYRTFYGKEYPSEIEFVSLSDTEAFEYEDTFLNTEAEKDQRRNIDETFNKIAVYNTTQGTGTLNTIVLGDNSGTRLTPFLEYSETGTVKLNKVLRGFRFNNIFDNTKQGCEEQPMVIKDKCKPNHEINEEVFECLPEQRQNFIGKVLNDDHLIYKLSYDNDPTVKLKLLTVKTNVKKDIR
jgi:hypothetical protein